MCRDQAWKQVLCGSRRAKEYRTSYFAGAQRKSSHSFSSVPARTPAAPAADALDRLPVLEVHLGHAADARAVEVGLLGLDAAQAAQVLVAGLLPLCDERCVGVAVLEQPVVQRL